VEGYGRRKYKADFIKYLIYSQSEGDETMVHLDFLFETGSLPDEKIYVALKSGYESLSRKINKFIQYVDESWDDFD
jgi:four helix bundle protein